MGLKIALARSDGFSGAKSTGRSDGSAAFAARAVVRRAIRDGVDDVTLLSGKARRGRVLSPTQVAVVRRIGATLEDRARTNLATYALAVERAIHLVEQVPCDRQELHTLVHSGVREALTHALALTEPAELSGSLREAPVPTAVRAVLDGATPESVATADDPSGLASYPFVGPQIAILAWPDPALGADAAAALGSLAAVGNRWEPVRTVTDETADGIVCAWLALAPGQAEVLDPAGLADLVAPGVHLVVSGVREGLDGFRAAHREVVRALGVVRIAEPDRRQRVTTTAEVGAIALMMDDLRLLREWVQATLGDLVIDDQDHEDLRETLRVYLKRGGSLTRAGAELYLHRNTVLKRVKQARALTPVDPAYDTAHFQTALDACRLIGAPVLRAA